MGEDSRSIAPASTAAAGAMRAATSTIPTAAARLSSAVPSSTPSLPSVRANGARSQNVSGPGMRPAPPRPLTEQRRVRGPDVADAHDLDRLVAGRVPVHADHRQRGDDERDAPRARPRSTRRRRGTAPSTDGAGRSVSLNAVDTAPPPSRVMVGLRKRYRSYGRDHVVAVREVVWDRTRSGQIRAR